MSQPPQRSPSRPAAAPAPALALAVAISLGLGGCGAGADADALVVQARSYQQRGEPKSAVIQLKNALQKNPAHRAARVLLAEVYSEQGDAVSAEKELRRALALGMPAAGLALPLGTAMLMQGQYQRLLDEIAPALDPAGQSRSSAAILALRGSALLGLDQPGPASAVFEEALKRDPASAAALLGLARVALAQQRGPDADALLARAIKAEPANTDCLRLQADLLRLRGEGAQAQAAYQKILALRPRQARSHLDLANLLTDSAGFSQARAHIAAARKLAPGTVGVFHAQALLDFREGKHAAALESLQQVLRAAPEHLPSVLLLGAVHSALGAHQQAEQHLQKFLAAYPGHLAASRLMGALYLRTNKAQAAVTLLEPLAASHGRDVELLTLAGEANLRAHRFSRAAAWFEQASALRPEHADLHAALALSRMAGGDTGRAVAELERAAGLERKSPRAGVLLVMLHLRANHPDKALAAAAQLKSQGDNPLVRNLEGGAWMAKRDFARARTAFDGALALDAAYLPALDNLAQLDAIEKRPYDAARRYRAALEKAPRNVELMDALARLAAAQGDTAQARAWLEQASRENPDALGPALRLAHFYARNGEPKSALILAQKLQAGNPSNAEALALLAHVYYLNENFSAAADSYAMLAALVPGTAGPHLRLAQARLAARDPDAAIAAFRKAVSLEPGLPEAQAGLARLLIGQKRLAEALDLALAAQKRQPASAAGHKIEADVLTADGRLGPALKAYERAFALEPGGPLLTQLHGALLRSGKAAEADARMARWLGEHPADVPTRLYYASTKVVAADHRGAIVQLQAVLAHDPDNLAALNDLAWSLLQVNDKQALAYAERAYRLAPDSPTVMDTLGWIELGNGQVARALQLLQKASALAPEAGEIRYHFGMVLARAGDRRAARRELERALASPREFAKRAEAKALLATL